MKIRNGFVSNSSSSSFIFSLPSKPKSVKEVKNIFFDKDQRIYSYNSYEKFTTSKVAKELFKLIKHPNSQDKDYIIRAFECKWCNQNIDLYKSNDYVELQSKAVQEAKIEANKFFEENKDKEIYVIDIYDDTDLGSAMEHGPLFDHIKHIKVCNH